MSFQLMAWASEQRTGSPTRKAVLLALANAGNHHTGRCDPAVAAICEETELGKTAVKTALADLEKAGMIERSRKRRQDGSLGTYSYSFPLFSLGTGRVQPEPGGGSSTRAGTRLAEPGSKSSNQEVVGPPLPPHAEYDPIKGRKIDGHDLPWDALARATASYGSANGSRMRTALRSIREEVWAELQEHGVTLQQAGADLGVGYERGLAHAIEARAGFLIREKPDLTWGPEGIARWWSRAATLAASEDVERIAQEAVELKRLGAA